MPDLQPISSEQDILAEAARVVRPAFQPVPQQPVASTANVATDQGQQVQLQSVVNSVSARPYMPSSQSLIDTVIVDNNSNTYTYRLPVISYVFAWMYLVAAVVTAGYLANYLYLVGQYSSASEYSSVTSKIFWPVIMPCLALIAACIAAFILILTKTRNSRYVALGISGLMIAGELYLVIKSFSNIGIRGWFTTYVVYNFVIILPFLPYAILPIFALSYLVSKKAVIAYNRTN